MKWYVKVLKNYAKFNGRARRKEFWYFTLVNFIIYMAIWTGSVTLGSMNPESTIAGVLMMLLGVYGLAVFIPSLAVSIRRLHDTNRSGWWVLIGLVPLIGAVVLLVFYVQDSQQGENQYGPNPKGEATAGVQV